MVDVQASLDAIAGRPALAQAAEQGARLVDLWPLTNAEHLANDAKYAEDLQVRISMVLAQLMTGEDVTIPDAEYVYEGAEDIPGRPQDLVDALMAANDAIEAAAQAQDDQSKTLADLAETLGSGWDQARQQDVAAGVAKAEQSLDGQNKSPESSRGKEGVTQALATSLEICRDLLQRAGADSDHAAAAAPVLVYVNELNERLGIPRAFLSAEDVIHALGLLDDPEAFADLLAPLVGAEWDHHRQEVLWDPEEAKRKAKEDDERKSREALQAKFAHVPEDPNKPPVEL
ncbi:hypothetical protein [Bifidobacterium mellis]|uniref:Uncharacterized protein n=1 Tax=Bifidobacterium mellis TaxID=1293823 RepID=A0A0F4L1T2_9BIFI|nr:hypothetical protein [Bifidobacterium mellis]KJY52164.1 Uncharacterized protein JF70_02530 [Bifidobacterium mellis]